MLLFPLPKNLFYQIRDHAQAYTALGKVDADNVSNKAKLDYSHDSVEKEYGLNLHVQNRKHDIFPTFTLTPHTLCVSEQITYLSPMANRH